MNTPPLLLAAACALWGWQTGQWLVAAAAALALEGSRVVPLRWNVTQVHFNRLSDFCSVLTVAVGAYLYLAFGNPRALLLLFQWLPVVLLPLALAQAWGNQQRVGVGAFVWNLRKDPEAARIALNIGYPCFAVWLLAASAANVRSGGFFGALVALGAWALWAARPRRHAPAAWLALLTLAAATGYGAQLGMSRLQGWLEDTVPEWLSASGARTDPYQSRTDLGYIGELKLDDAILLRVRPEGALHPPLLLHRATYNGYFAAAWTARNAPLTPRPPNSDAGRWQLAPSRPGAERLTVFDFSPRGNQVLSLPRGTIEVSGLAAPYIKANGLGTVQAEVPPGHFQYVARIAAGAAAGSAPDEEDLRLPKSEEALFARLAQDLRLAGLPPEQAVSEVRRFFARGFGYSLWQPGAGRDRDMTLLADFLLKTRAGHCEYFATATTLLLRAAGIPARYATGYSVQEYSRIENAYVVRARHAHAWASAWVDGAWVDVDTTPAVWASVEAQVASWWAPVSDLWSWTRFRLSRLTGGAQDEARTAAMWTGIALMLAAWLAWRLYQQRRLLVIGRQAGAGAQPEPGPAGGDSEFFQVERALARGGLPREPGETVMAWLARIAARLPAGAAAEELAALAELHYRYRFDPAGITRAERDRLRSAAQGWLARNPLRADQAR